MQDVGVDRGTDCGSDYFLLTAKMQLKFKILTQAEKQMFFNSTKLKDTDTIQKHLVEVCNRSAYLEKKHMGQEDNITLNFSRLTSTNFT